MYATDSGVSISLSSNILEYSYALAPLGFLMPEEYTKAFIHVGL